MKHRYSLTARPFIIAATVGTVALFVAWTDGGVPKAHAHHTQAELDGFRGNGVGLPFGRNEYFIASGECNGCHGLDLTPPVLANHTEDGVDVNPVDGWRSTMMANSAKDPFWRAKVSHEGKVNPGHASALEHKCTSCHAPMGHYDQVLTGGGLYAISDLEFDPVARDGVSCMACHMQSADSAGLLFSGALRFDTNDVEYGPYDVKNLFGAPMTSFVGYEPQYGAHINDAGLCAGCHTLITETADLSGELTGDHFVEQATYHEWVNSVFNTDVDPENGITCQGCHLPRIDDAMVISALYDFLANEEYRRSPYGKHELAGGNTFMLKLLKANIASLGITADSVHFDSTIARTNRMLQQNSLLMETTVPDRDLDTAFIDVKLTNLVGHKFPSGYPSRRAFIELVVLNAGGDTLFQSGRYDGAYEVVGHDADWEPHHDVIRTPDEAQIYEMVMGDVNGNKTTVLERAKTPLKDNRLTPLGFSTTHYTYDTTLVAGVPATDTDFNHDGLGAEGSGTDITHYHVPMGGYAGLITIHAKVWYQSAPPRWMEEMFSFNSAEIDTFRTMFEQADGTPVLVRSTETTDLSVAVDNLAELGVRIFPNPLRDGLLRVEGLDARTTGIEVFDLRGALVSRHVPNGERTWQVKLPSTAATYLVVVNSTKGRFVERVVSF